MKAPILDCTLKKSPNQSNSGLLAGEVVSGLQEFGVECEMVRLVDLNILPGVLSDEGDGDEWPGVREKILGADILVMATPTWLAGERHRGSLGGRVAGRDPGLRPVRRPGVSAGRGGRVLLRQDTFGPRREAGVVARLRDRYGTMKFSTVACRTTSMDITIVRPIDHFKTILRRSPSLP